MERGEEERVLVQEWAGLPLPAKPLAAPPKAATLREGELVLEKAWAQEWEDLLQARRFLRYSDLQRPRVRLRRPAIPRPSKCPARWQSVARPREPLRGRRRRCLRKATGRGGTRRGLARLAFCGLGLEGHLGDADPTGLVQHADSQSKPRVFIAMDENLEFRIRGFQPREFRE